MSMGIQKIDNKSSIGSKICHFSNGKVKEIEDDPVLGLDSGTDSDDYELAAANCELGMLEGQLCSIPYEIYDLPDLREILSIDTWNSCLTDEERFCLSAYLPDMEQETFWLTMKELFDGSDIYFGNPLDTFFKRLKGGFYPPKVVCFREGLQFLQRKRYYYSLRSYHDKMVQMFIDMRRIWSECDMNCSVEERISMWKRRRKQKGINLLDLNESPKDDHQSNEQTNFETKAMSLADSKTAMGRFLSANRVAFVTPNCRQKVVPKVKALGNGSFHNHHPKVVMNDSSERSRFVPKGLLKVARKVPPVHLEQSNMVTRGAQPTFLVKKQGIQDIKFSSLPASLPFQDPASLHESTLLRQKIDGNRVHPTLHHPQYLLNQQENIIGTCNHSESSTREVKGEMVPSLGDISLLGKHKLFGGDVGRGPDKEYAVRARQHIFGGENFFPITSGGTKDFSLRSLEAFPLHNQYHFGKQHMAPFKEEHVTVYPRFPKVVPAISDVGKDKLEASMDSSSDQMKGKSDISARKAEKISKSHVSEEVVKDVPVLPLTYKRRKALAKANSLNIGEPLASEAILNSSIPKESNQHFRESEKTMKIKFRGEKVCP